ncbi:discoidin domain-containing protein [Actinoplanes sp. CA-142083]|uniref:galactose-binding domain-containing protein n=1 Tax=Actinoplanes sp. CA-142083 TaxID=3239903 RepID=UPI003D8AB123
MTRRVLVPAFLAASIQLLALAAAPGAAYASDGDSSVARCSLQVADAAKQIRPVSGYALDTANLVGDPAGPSPASAVPTHKDFNNGMRTVWDAPQTGDTTYLGAGPQMTAVDQGSAAAPTTAITGYWTHNGDVSGATEQTLRAVSADGGSSWPTPTTVSGGTAPFSVQLRDGRVFSVGFKATSGYDYSGTITDTTGAAATATPIAVKFPDTVQTASSPLTYSRTAGLPIQRSDGSVLLPMYGSDRANTAHSIVALTVATPAAGQTDWTFQALRPDLLSPLSATNKAVTFGSAYPNSNFSEAGLLERPNGSLIAVMRNLVVGQSSGSDFMKWSTSTDNGLSWSAYATMTGTIGGWNGNGVAQPTASGLPGINPQLELMTNGLIVLSSGKPDNWIAFSTTGNATGWTGQYTYRNCPTTSVTPSRSYYTGNDPDQWRYGSSGNTSLARTGSNRILQFGDNCHNYHWGCVRTDTSFHAQPAQSPYTVDLTSRIWQRQVSVVTPNTGKLDLAGLKAAGQLQVTGNMTWGSAAHPRAGAAGAFDGSRAYWSSAIATGGPGTLQLDLGKPYTLNRVGLSLRPQLPESATVEVSADNATWTTVTSLSNAVTRALTYADITPVAARYVRVTVPATSGCDAGLGTSCAFLNEIELYSTVDGFENDPWGNLPRGADASRPALMNWITTDTSGGSHQALRIADSSADAIAGISFAAPAAAARTLTFRVKPLQWATNVPEGGFLFTVDSGTTPVLSLAVFKDGTLHAYTAGDYVALGGPSVPMNAWSTITVTRTASGGTLQINGGTPVAVPVRNSATTVSGYTFASGGTEPNGDQVLIDDVSFS